MKYEQPEIVIISCDDLDIITESVSFDNGFIDEGEALDRFN